MNERDAALFAQDVESGAKERICSDERIEDTVEHPTWVKAVKIMARTAEAIS